MSHNPLTTARINRAVYDLRHWKITLLVGTVFVLFRFLSGRDLRGGRKTDATFFRGARAVRGGWWASAPGSVRMLVRFAAIGLLWLWTVNRTLVVVLAIAGAGVGAWLLVRAIRVRQHERRVLAPLWGAVAGIIGVPVNEPPRAWLSVPADLSQDGAEIVVGLLAADSKDDQRVNHLLILFSQRFGHPFVARVDYARRLVHLRFRPDEPQLWPPVAEVLGVGDGELAADWLTMPDDIEVETAAIIVRLPDDVIDDEPVTDRLRTLVNQRFRGEWVSKTERERRRVVLTRKRPEPEPPKTVDWLTYQEPSRN